MPSAPRHIELQKINNEKSDNKLDSCSCNNMGNVSWSPIGAQRGFSKLTVSVMRDLLTFKYVLAIEQCVRVKYPLTVQRWIVSDIERCALLSLEMETS